MSAKPEEGAPPKVVALQLRRAHHIVDRRLQRLLGALHSDPDLNLGAATGALLASAGDLLARLDAYLLYPHRCFSMCRRWLPATAVQAVTAFLQAPDEDLDLGFSLPLQRLASARGSEAEQKAFLLSTPVQDFLEEAAISFCSTSLAAERTGATENRRGAKRPSCLHSIPRSAMHAVYA